MNRSPKKLDKLELRLPAETKRAFTDRCRTDGRTASEVMRQFIETYLARPLTFVEPPMIRRSLLTYGGVAAAVSAALVVSVIALTPRPSQAEPDYAAVFKSIDKNGDGRLSRDEFSTPRKPATGGPRETTAGLIAGFEDTDTNKDKAISLAEFEAFCRAEITKRFLALDANSDGKLTLAELQRPSAPLGSPGPKGQTFGMYIAGAARGFIEHFDKNKDGVVDESEFAAF